MRFLPLSDKAILIDLGHHISRECHERVIRLCESLQDHPIRGITEVVPAYSSVAVFYDPVLMLSFTEHASSVFEYVVSQLKILFSQMAPGKSTSGREMKIPVCYDPAYGPDLADICDRTNLMPKDVIRLHSAPVYHVYMMGFLPGFAYLGEVEDVLFVPRKNSPSQVTAGSIGIAGRQTGLYPMDSPGGWNIIGRTPVTLFDPGAENPTFLRPGDTVHFYSISANEFEHYPARHS